MIDDRARLVLHRRLEDVLGADSADTLMAHLPPVGWSDVATNDALSHTRTALSSDLARTTAELRAEMADLRTELKGDIADLRTELKDDIADLRTELHQSLRQMTWTLVAASFASAGVTAGAVLAAVTLTG